MYKNGGSKNETCGKDGRKLGNRIVREVPRIIKDGNEHEEEWDA